MGGVTRHRLVEGGGPTVGASPSGAPPPPSRRSSAWGLSAGARLGRVWLQTTVASSSPVESGPAAELRSCVPPGNRKNLIQLVALVGWFGCRRIGLGMVGPCLE